MRVKIFTESYTDTLEKKINEFVNKLQFGRFARIQYSSHFDSLNGTDVYTAIVLWEESQ